MCGRLGKRAFLGSSRPSRPSPGGGPVETRGPLGCRGRPSAGASLSTGRLGLARAPCRNGVVLDHVFCAGNGERRSGGRAKLTDHVAMIPTRHTVPADEAEGAPRGRHHCSPRRRASARHQQTTVAAMHPPPPPPPPPSSTTPTTHPHARRPTEPESLGEDPAEKSGMCRDSSEARRQGSSLAVAHSTPLRPSTCSPVFQSQPPPHPP